METVKPFFGCSDEQGKEQPFFIEAAELGRDFVAQHRLKQLSLPVAQKGVFADRSGKEPFVEADDEERAERSSSGRHRVQNRHSSDVSVREGDRGALEPMLIGLEKMDQRNLFADGIQRGKPLKNFPDRFRR